MSVLYNMDIFSALTIIYGEQTDGFPEEDFETNERERGLVLPEILKRFLRDYGYMSINRLSGSAKFLHPNIMSKRYFSYVDNPKLPLTIIGRAGEYLVGIATAKRPDPEIYLIMQSPEEVKLLPSDDTISEIIKVMLCGVLLKNDNAVTVDSPRRAVQLLKENGVDVEEIHNSPVLRREYSICFTEETRTFTVAEFVDGTLLRFFFIRDEHFIHS